MKHITLDHVERLSHGKKSGAKIGSRSVGHHLRPHERPTYRRALKKGYLEIHTKDRANLWHIWEKACLAQNTPFLVLIKNPAENRGDIYQDNEKVSSASLAESKAQIGKLVEDGAERKVLPA